MFYNKIFPNFFGEIKKKISASPKKHLSGYPKKAFNIAEAPIEHKKQSLIE